MCAPATGEFEGLPATLGPHIFVAVNEEYPIMKQKPLCPLIGTATAARRETLCPEDGVYQLLEPIICGY